MNKGSMVFGGLLAVSGLLFGSPQAANSQEPGPDLAYACYVPSVGAVYRIDPTGTMGGSLQTACYPGDVEFSWTVGPSNSDHGALTGLSDNDHPQYLTRAGGLMTDTLGMNGYRIRHLGAGTEPGDAVPYEQAVKNGDAAGGDLGDTYPDPTVTKLQGNPVSATAPSDGQVLSWDGETSEWEPISINGASSPWDGWVYRRDTGAWVSVEPGGYWYFVGRANCPEGYIIINGGFNILEDPPYNLHHAVVMGNTPFQAGGGGWGWYTNVVIQNGSGATTLFQLNVFALCAPMGSS